MGVCRSGACICMHPCSRALLQQKQRITLMLRCVQATPPPQPDAAFLSWVQQEEGKKGLSFCIKGKNEDTPA